MLWSTRMLYTIMLLQLSLALTNGSGGNTDLVSVFRNAVTTFQNDLNTYVADIATLKVLVSELKEAKEKSDAKITELDDHIRQLRSAVELSSNSSLEVQAMATKMASMENDLKVLSTDFQSMQTNMNASLNSCVNDIIRDMISNLTVEQRNLSNSLEHELQSLQHALNLTQIMTGENLETLREMEKENIRRDNSKSESSQMLNQSMSRVMEMHTQMVQRINRTDFKKPAFQVTGGILTENGRLKFSRVLHDTTGNFSISSGEYMAPFPGTYLVWAQIDKTQGSKMYLFIMKSGVKIAASYTPVGGDATVTVITVTKVKAGELLYVTTAGASRITGYGLWSTFGGVLI